MALDTAADAKTFDWEDPLDLAARLSEDERMVWDSARAYAREKLLPRVVSAFAEERFVDAGVLFPSKDFELASPAYWTSPFIAESIPERCILSRYEVLKLFYRWNSPVVGSVYSHIFPSVPF